MPELGVSKKGKDYRDLADRTEHQAEIHERCAEVSQEAYEVYQGNLATAEGLYLEASGYRRVLGDTEKANNLLRKSQELSMKFVEATRTKYRLRKHPK